MLEILNRLLRYMAERVVTDVVEQCCRAVKLKLGIGDFQLGTRGPQAIQQ